MANWCLNNCKLFQNKTILELGSGVGVTGLILASNCSPKRVCLTDCHSTVLEVLCENVNLNVTDREIKQKEGKFQTKPCESLLIKGHVNNNNCTSVVEVRKLPWEIVDEKLCKTFGNVDTLIAADVVYDSDLFLPLINTLKCFLKSGVSEVFLACTVRNRNTLNHFLEAVGMQ